MVRLAVSVEGVTEERFVIRVLQPYFFNKNIYITPINLGGDIKIARISSELNKLTYSFDYVTTLYDFYGFKGKYIEDNKASLEEKIKLSVSEGYRPQIIPYVQMYEFEGLLFSSPEIIGTYLGNDLKQWAEETLQDFEGNPEKINDSFETAPSKRLEKSTSYKKTTDGPNIIQEIGLETVRQKCPGFDAWLSSLEALSTA